MSIQVDELSLVYRLMSFIECMIHLYKWIYLKAEIVYVPGECSIRVIEVTALLEYLDLEHLQHWSGSFGIHSVIILEKDGWKLVCKYLQD